MSVMLMESVTAVVESSYWQFYLQRGDAEWLPDQISDEAYQNHLECVGGFVYVGTSTYGSPTTVTIEVHDCEPNPAPAERIVEVMVDGEGSLTLWNWPGDGPVAQVELPVGPVSLRASWAGMEAASEFPEREAPGDLPSPEEIQLQLWPCSDRAG